MDQKLRFPTESEQYEAERESYRAAVATRYSEMLSRAGKPTQFGVQLNFTKFAPVGAGDLTFIDAAHAALLNVRIPGFGVPPRSHMSRSDDGRLIKITFLWALPDGDAGVEDIIERRVNDVLRVLAECVEKDSPYIFVRRLVDGVEFSEPSLLLA